MKSKKGAIFLVGGKGRLVEMVEEDYESEDVLQGLLGEYPDLLPGSQIAPDSPRRWLLIGRHALVPKEEQGPGWFEPDHVFLDQDAIPTIVEVKRSTDTRIRREVVGQMLDYAANAIRYWPVEKIRLKFESRCEEFGIDPNWRLGELIGDEDQEEFWDTVATNLKAGKIRMLFVADRIPMELRRIIEFLNEQMRPAEVLGVEIRQYVGEERQTLVPTVIGLTSEAMDAKAAGRRPSKQWDETSFIEDLENRVPKDEVDAAMRLIQWFKDRTLAIQWGKGATYGTCYPKLDIDGRSVKLLCIYAPSSTARVEVPLGNLPLPDSTKAEFVSRLNSIAGVSLPEEEEQAKYPSFALSALTRQTSMNEFFSVYEWAIRQMNDR